MSNSHKDEDKAEERCNRWVDRGLMLLWLAVLLALLWLLFAHAGE